MAKAVRRAAGFVVYRKTRNEIIEYLLMQASYANNHWTPPKGIHLTIKHDSSNCSIYWLMLFIGHLEENESNMDAAIRETDEEAGIKVKDLSVDHNFKKVLKVLVVLW
jgi:bis(5'-nucleosidyl)-tetraphosphatase